MLERCEPGNHLSAVHAQQALDVFIDLLPRPLVPPQRSLAPIIRGYEFGPSRTEVVCRLDKLTTALRLDRERCRLWALAQTLAWGFEGAVVYDKHVETARWLWQA